MNQRRHNNFRPRNVLFCRTDITTSLSSLCSSNSLCAIVKPLLGFFKALILTLSSCLGLFNQSPRDLFSNTFDDVVRLARDSPFSVNDVEALRELFKKLSSSIIDDGLIHKEELRLALFKTTAGENLFLDRVFDVFDEKKIGAIDFDEFVHALSIFHPNTPLADKIDFAFRLYDLRQNGFIQREEVGEANGRRHFVRNGVRVSEETLEAIVAKTFADADVDNDGKIGKEDWKTFVLRQPKLLKNMTLPYLKDITTVFPSFIFNTEVED